MHFPTKSVLVQKSFEMSRKVTKLRFVARKERVHREAQQDHLDKGRTKNRRSSLAEAMADRTLKVVDVTTTENEIKVSDVFLISNRFMTQYSIILIDLLIEYYYYYYYSGSS